jgi:hypothetical protein
MNIYETVWLFADNDNPNGDAKATYTVDMIPQGTNIWVTIALSYFSEGVSYDQQALGAAGCLVRSWDAYNSDGTVTHHDNTDFAGNSELIYNCAAVTLELAVTFARAYAQATLYSV